VKSSIMRYHGDLGGAAPAQLTKKKIGGVTDGIRAKVAHNEGSTKRLGETGLLMTGEADKTWGEHG